MKKITLGLALGVVLCTVAYFLAIPNIKQAEYDRGYNAGNQKGIAEGTNTGIAQGIAQLEAKQKQAHEQDSAATAEKQHELALRKAATKPKKVVKEIQNWHVIDGKIADPIIGNEPAPPAPATASGASNEQ